MAMNYDVESDSYTVGDLQFATAFKRREIAEAVMAQLRSEWHEVMECRQRKDGKLKLTGRRRRILHRARKRTTRDRTPF